MTDQQEARAKILRFPIDPTNARDELNLCEFPLAVLSDRSPKDRLELTFTDTLWDESEKKEIDRTLHVSAPPKYGLPTAKDEEVLLALIHLTDQVNQFTDRTVHFSRYELIKLLGWNEGGKSYQRITESLARWKSVTLDYRNAWRDHRAKSWVSEVFSIIDNVSFYDIEKRRPSSKSEDAEQTHLPLSTFVWNRVFFESMQAKYFKRLDFGFYQRLHTSTAKRLFRFLDKRFGSGRPSWQFDLHEFAFEHIGLSRNYDTGKIKEKLMPAIAELEQAGYLEPLAKEHRFEKQGKSWRVYFSKATKQASVPDKGDRGDDLAAMLIDRGVSEKAAAELAGQFDAEQIRSQVDVFDWIIEGDIGNLRNPAGYLAESIRSGFKPPAGYQTKSQRECIAKDRAKRAEVAREEEQREQDERRYRQQQRDHVAAIRVALSDDHLAQLEHDARDNAEAWQRDALKNPAVSDCLLDLLIDELILSRFPMERHEGRPAQTKQVATTLTT